MLHFKFNAAAAVVALATIASPALANSAANADVAAPLRAAEAARASAVATTTAGDEQFSRLFASWQSLEGGRSETVAAPRGTVSIPSITPLDGQHMTSGYGMRWHPVLGGHRAHKGVDLASPVGTPIHATADGVVSKAERFGGYGLFVQLEHGGSLETRYGHMSRIAVAEGQHVHKGDVIGYVGSTGRSTGPHLHYEVRIDGQAVNPVAYMHDGETLASN